jgi:hypothetical protein
VARPDSPSSRATPCTARWTRLKGAASWGTPNSSSSWTSASSGSLRFLVVSLLLPFFFRMFTGPRSFTAKG